jgi:large subunit ribosomal protein L21
MGESRISSRGSGKKRNIACHSKDGVAASPPFFQNQIIMAYAVFKTGGKQYRVSEGDTISVEKLDAEPGSEVTFSEVLCTGAGADVAFAAGAETATVVAEVVEQAKGKKVLAYKYRRRKGYHRTVGHRRRLTKVKIKAINA